jgi:hypothetical protein
MVLAGFATATVVFVVFTWNNVMLSLSANSVMVDYGDFVVLGRVPVVARMLGTNVAAGGWQFGDALFVFAALFAALTGFAVGRVVGSRPPWLAMLAAGGTALYLSTVLIGGFGYAYKAAFLLLAVPLLSRLPASRTRLVAGSGLAALVLVVCWVAWLTAVFDRGSQVRGLARWLALLRPLGFRGEILSLLGAPGCYFRVLHCC